MKVNSEKIFEHKQCFIKEVFFRELGRKPVCNHSFRLLQYLFRCSRRKLVLRKKITSKANNYLNYNCGKIFVQDASTQRVNCYSLYGCDQNVPKIYTYRLQPKIEDCVLFNGPVHSLYIQDKQGYRPSIFVLRSNVSLEGRESILYQYDLEDGQLLSTVYLSSKWKFVEAISDFESGRLVIKSAKKQFLGAEEMNHINSDVAVRLILFDYLPLEFVASFLVRRSVFGRKISTVHVSQNLLLIYYEGCIIRLFSLQEILKHISHIYLLGDRLSIELFIHLQNVIYRITNEVGSFIVGQAPFGIPNNIDLQESPPCLFEVKSYSHELSIGGSPWFYIFSPRPKCYEVRIFYIIGELESDKRSLEPDFVSFHPLKSASLIQQSSTSLRFWEIQHLDTKPSLKETFRFLINVPCTNSWECHPGVSLYGRRLNLSDAMEQMFYDEISDLTFDFEDELDLLGILTATEGNNPCELMIDKLFLYSKQYCHYRTFDLQEQIEGCIEMVDITLTMDLDIVAIKIKDKRTCTLLVYRIEGPLKDEIDDVKDKRTRTPRKDSFVPIRSYNTRKKKLNYCQNY